MGIPVNPDIAGTARTDDDTSWRVKGATGFGARLLIDFLMHFEPISADTASAGR